MLLRTDQKCEKLWKQKIFISPVSDEQFQEFLQDTRILRFHNYLVPTNRSGAQSLATDD